MGNEVVLVPIFHVNSVKSVRIIKSFNSELLQSFITKLLTESRKSNSFSTFVAGTSLPDACDKRIKMLSKERIESLTRCLNDRIAKIYALQ